MKKIVVFAFFWGTQLTQAEWVVADYQDEMPQLTLEEMQKYEHALEWWFFEVETTDHSKLAFIFNRRNALIAKNKPSLFIEYYPAEEKNFRHVEKFKPEDFVFLENGEVGTIQLTSQNEIKIQKDTSGAVSSYQVRILLKKFEANLVFISLLPGGKPSPDGCYLFHKENKRIKSCMVMGSPYMKVEGSIIFKGEMKEIEGIGYHDHPWATDDFLHTHHEWIGGRSHVQDKTIVYNYVVPQKSFTGGMHVLYVGDTTHLTSEWDEQFKFVPSEWKSESFLFNFKFPHQVDFQSDLLSLRGRASFNKSLFNFPVFNRSQAAVLVKENNQEQQEGDGWMDYWKINDGLQNFYRKLIEFIFFIEEYLSVKVVEGPD